MMHEKTQQIVSCSGDMSILAEYTLINGFEFSFRVDPEREFIKDQITIGFESTTWCGLCGKICVRDSDKKQNSADPVKFISANDISDAVKFAHGRYNFQNIVFAPAYGEILLHPNLKEILNQLCDQGTFILTTSFPKLHRKQAMTVLSDIMNRFDKVVPTASLIFTSPKDIQNIIDFLNMLPRKELAGCIRFLHQQHKQAGRVLQMIDTSKYDVTLKPLIRNETIYGNDVEVKGVASYWMYDGVGYKRDDQTLNEDIVPHEFTFVERAV